MGALFGKALPAAHCSAGSLDEFARFLWRFLIPTILTMNLL